MIEYEWQKQKQNQRQTTQPLRSAKSAAKRAASLLATCHSPLDELLFGIKHKQAKESHSFCCLSWRETFVPAAVEVQVEVEANVEAAAQVKRCGI